ncbi:MAG: nucleotide exchange factor GrpE, partial [Proteobacteria bacterium]|nr:nucleotide exchange factor GrpE [Pseudomonadota bacterium]
MTDDNPPAGDGAPTARDGRAEVRELERQLEEARTQVRDAEARAAENLDRWQRAQADLANFKRRVQFDRDLDQKYASAQVLADFLRVLDGFDRAWKSLPSSLRMLSWI